MINASDPMTTDSDCQLTIDWSLLWIQYPNKSCFVTKIIKVWSKFSLEHFKSDLKTPQIFKKKTAHKKILNVLKLFHNRIIYCFLDWKLLIVLLKSNPQVNWICQHIFNVCAGTSMITLTGRCSLGEVCRVLWFCHLCWIFFVSQLFKIKSFYF